MKQPKRIRKIIDFSKRVFTIPNVISFVRILLIPVFAWAYMTDHRITALVVVILSGVSDKIDGTLARLLHQVSNLGKWLDPLADKLTQVTLAVLMFIKFSGSSDVWMRRFAWVFLLFIGKEVFMLLIALIMLLMKLRPAAAEIWGKIATVVFYVVMCLLFLAGPDVGVLLRYIHWELPQIVVQVLVYINLAMTFIALFSYIPDTVRKLFGKGKA